MSGRIDGGKRKFGGMGLKELLQSLIASPWFCSSGKRGVAILSKSCGELVQLAHSICPRFPSDARVQMLASQARYCTGSDWMIFLKLSHSVACQISEWARPKVRIRADTFKAAFISGAVKMSR